MQFMKTEIDKCVGGIRQWQTINDNIRAQLLEASEKLIRTKYDSVDAFNSRHRRAIIIQAAYMITHHDMSLCDEVTTAFFTPETKKAKIWDTTELKQLMEILASGILLTQKIVKKEIQLNSAKVDTSLDDASPEAQAALVERMNGTEPNKLTPTIILLTATLEKLTEANDNLRDYVFGYKEEEDNDPT